MAKVDCIVRKYLTQCGYAVFSQPKAVVISKRSYDSYQPHQNNLSSDKEPEIVHFLAKILGTFNPTINQGTNLSYITNGNSGIPLHAVVMF